MNSKNVQLSGRNQACASDTASKLVHCSVSALITEISLYSVSLLENSLLYSLQPFQFYFRGVQLAAVNYNSPTESLSTFSASKSQQSLDRSPHSSVHESENIHYSSASTIRTFDSTNDHNETKTNGAPWIRRPSSPANSDDK